MTGTSTANRRGEVADSGARAGSGLVERIAAACPSLLRAGIPGVSCVQVPGVGHMSNMEAPAFVTDQLLGLLA